MAVPDRGNLPQDVNLDNFMERLLENMTKALTEEDPFPHHAPTTTGNPIQLGPRLPSAQQWTTDMIQGAQNNAGKWLRNTLAPKKSPKAEAIRAAGKYNNSMQQVIQQNRYAAGVTNYDEDAAVETIRAVGQQAYTAGIAARERKIQTKIAALQQLMSAHVDTLDRMPTDTPDQREAKVIANLRGMRTIGLTMKGVRGTGTTPAR